MYKSCYSLIVTKKTLVISVECSGGEVKSVSEYSFVQLTFPTHTHTPRSVVVSTLGSQPKGSGFESRERRSKRASLLTSVHVAASSYGM